MIRLLKWSLMPAFLMAIWLLLNRSLAPGQIVLGAVLGGLGTWVLTALDPPAGKLPRPLAAMRLFLLVVADIVRSNILVARIIWRDSPGRRPGFVRIPLELRSPYGLAALACIITATPGTIWVDFDSESRVLTIHVLNLVEEKIWIDTIKGRYERHLREILE